MKLISHRRHTPTCFYMSHSIENDSMNAQLCIRNRAFGVFCQTHNKLSHTHPYSFTISYMHFVWNVWQCVCVCAENKITTEVRNIWTNDDIYTKNEASMFDNESWMCVSMCDVVCFAEIVGTNFFLHLSLHWIPYACDCVVGFARV